MDPPYGTNEKWDYYKDSMGLEEWLSFMKPRLELSWALLSDNGSLWISIDDRMMAYLRVLLEQLFGLNTFVATIVWQKIYARDNRGCISDSHEYILVYAKDKKQFRESRNCFLSFEAKQLLEYKNPDNDPRGVWRPISVMSAQEGQGRPNQVYAIEAPSGDVFWPSKGVVNRYIPETFEALKKDNRIWFGAGGNTRPQKKLFLSESSGLTPHTWWPHTEVGHTHEALREMHALFGREAAFPTPKPERLLERIIHIGSKEGGLVLDPFMGSGTACAVAHKMGRRWVGIEAGDHIFTHCQPRLAKVCRGEDLGGVTSKVQWLGGGGFDFLVVPE